MESSFSDLLVKSTVLGQNLSTQGIRSSGDCKLFDLNLAMHIKEEKEEVMVGFDDTLVTSTQDLGKKVKIEPVTRQNIMAGTQERKNLAGEPSVSHLFQGKGGAICFKVEEGSIVKENQSKETMEALDLSLPKKKGRNFKDRCAWITGDDAEYESSLLMEVDEIEDIRTEPEVEEDDSSFELGEMHWGNIQLSDQASLSVPLDGTIAEDVLLIDIQGVPYTLTPDGTKVPQMDPEEHTEQPDSTFKVENDQPCSSSTLTEVVHSEQTVSHSSVLVDKLSYTIPVHGTSFSIQSTTAKSSPVLSNLSQLSVLPALSSVPSQPIQVMANRTSNTPILLLPSSQLQAASASSDEPNSGLMSLSLPLTFAQNTQSSPMFLVLSSLPVSSSQTSATQLPVLNSSSGQLSQISSMSSVALPLTASLPCVGSSVMASVAPAVKILVPESQCSTVSGSDKLASPSPLPATVSPAGASNVSSASHSRHLETDKSDSWTPKSFREALLRPTPSPENRTVHPPDTQTQSLEVPPTSYSSPKNPGPPSPVVTSNLSEPWSLQTKPVQEFVPISGNASDSVSSQDEHLVSSSSPTPPISPPGTPIFPTNQPKNLSPSSPSTCPRRILYCRYCPRVFYYLSDLERHSITHSQSKPHVCPLCGKAFKRSSHLERHKHIHTGQRNFMCSICCKRFREAGELLRHQRVHTGEKPFQCLLCHMRFAERNTLRRHTKRKHQGREQEAMEADGGCGGTSQALVLVQQEESSEWYSSAVPEQDSDSELDKDGE